VSRVSRRWAWLLLAVVALGCRTGAGPEEAVAGLELPPLSAQPTVPQLVVLVSVAGLGPDAYRGPLPTMPLLARMARAGAFADRVEPVAPASSSPAHASLITGRQPAQHRVTSERLLGDRGVRRAGFDHASQLRGPSLWSVSVQRRPNVAALGWPTTVGAAIPLLLPDVGMPPRGATWLEALADKSTPWLLERAQSRGGDDPETAIPGAARDGVLVGVACDVIASPSPPSLLLLHLAQPRVPVARFGPGTPAAREAYAGVDARLNTLLGCLRDEGRLATSALVVVGDTGVVPVHTVLSPNAWLEEEGLLARDAAGRGLRGWRALVRSNGGSAFVYARSEGDAVRARRELEARAQDGRFRVVSAEELLDAGADPEAWFGLEARLGYVFTDDAAVIGPVPSALLGAAGYLSDVPAMSPGFVAWGSGVRRGVRIPWLRQIDVAPTVALLLGVPLDEADGRAPLGALNLPAAQRTRGDAGGD